MAEAEVAALKEALRKQTLLGKELYVELEEERKAVASGVVEAISMIMRLQEEKALEKMEACHRRRMADEKMQHAEESMLSLKEVIFQKELEIQTLKYQVHCFKQKLSSIGINIEFEQIRMDCYPSLRRGSFARILNRNISLPAVRLEELSSETDTLNKLGFFSPIIQSQRNFSEQLSNYLATTRQRLLKLPRSHPVNSNERITQFRLSREYRDNKSFSNGVFERTSSIDEMKLKYLKLSGNSLNLSQARYAWNRLKYGSFNRCVLRTRSDGDALCLIDSQDTNGVRDGQNGHDLYEIPNNLLLENLSETRHSSGKTHGYLKCQNKSNESHTLYCGNKPTRQQKEESEIYPLLAQETKNGVCPHPTESGQLKERILWLDEYIKDMSQEDLERNAEELKLLKSTITRLDTKAKNVKNEKPKIDCHWVDDTMFSYLVEAMLYISI